MEKDIVDGKIGEVGAYDLEFKGGKLTFKVGVEHLGMSAAIELGIDSDKILDAIAKAIPGQVDDAVLNIVRAGLKMPV